MVRSKEKNAFAKKRIKIAPATQIIFWLLTAGIDNPANSIILLGSLP
jgi:hypothetical protein